MSQLIIFSIIYCPEDHLIYKNNGNIFYYENEAVLDIDTKILKQMSSQTMSICNQTKTFIFISFTSIIIISFLCITSSNNNNSVTYQQSRVGVARSCSILNLNTDSYYKKTQNQSNLHTKLYSKKIQNDYEVNYNTASITQNQYLKKKNFRNKIENASPQTSLNDKLHKLVNKIKLYTKENISCDIALNSYLPTFPVVNQLNTNTRPTTNRNANFRPFSTTGQTTRSLPQNRFYSSPFIESQSGSYFTKKDLLVKLNMNSNWFILVNEKFSISNEFNWESGFKEFVTNQHTSFFGKLQLEMPLYDILESDNGFTVNLNYKYKKNIQRNAVPGLWQNDLEIEFLNSNRNVVGSFMPTRNKLFFGFKFKLNNDLKNTLDNMDFKKIADELSLDKKILNYASTNLSASSVYPSEQSNSAFNLNNDLETLSNLAIFNLNNSNLDNAKKTKLKKLILILKKKNINKQKKVKAYKEIVKIVEKNILEQNKKNLNSFNTTNNNRTLLVTLDLLTVASIAGLITVTFVPHLKLVSILNPFFYIITFCISIIIKLFLNGTVNEGIVYIIKTSSSHAIETGVQNLDPNSRLFFIIQSILVSLVVSIILVIIKQIKNLLFESPILLNPQDPPSSTNLTLNPGPTDGQGPNSNSIVTDIVTTNVESFIDTTSLTINNSNILDVSFHILDEPIQPIYCGNISMTKPIVKLIRSINKNITKKIRTRLK